MGKGKESSKERTFLEGKDLATAVHDPVTSVCGAALEDCLAPSVGTGSFD